LSSNAIKDEKSRYKPGRLEDRYHLTKPYELKDLLEKLQEAFLSREGRASWYADAFVVLILPAFDRWLNPFRGNSK